MATAVQKWFTVRQLAVELRRSPKTVRRLLRPHRSECLVVREGKHPRRILWVPRRVLVAIEREILKSLKGCQENST